MTINKNDLENAIKGLSIIESKPEPVPTKIDLSKLSIVEKRHMDAFVAKGMPDIDLYDKDQMLEAYLAGADVHEIVQMFPNTQAGGIIYLKITEGWGVLRKEYIEDLQYKSQIKLMQTKANAVSSVSMLVNMFHKEIQPKILQYMQTGDPQYLPKRFGIKSFGDYKKFIDLLSKLSKLSPGDALSIEPPQTVNIKTETLNIGDNKSNQIINKESDQIQSSAHKLLAEFYGKK